MFVMYGVVSECNIEGIGIGGIRELLIKGKIYDFIWKFN